MKKKHEIFRALRLSEQEFLHFVSEYVQIPSEAPKVGAASVYAGQAWLRDKLVEWGWDPNGLEFWEESLGNLTWPLGYQDVQENRASCLTGTLMWSPYPGKSWPAGATIRILAASRMAFCGDGELVI